MKSALRTLLPVLALVPMGMIHQVRASETSQKFESMLDEACQAQESVERCSCYAKRVTEQYNDQELVNIFNLMKDQEANSMFLVVHANIGRSCKVDIAD